MIEFIKSLLSLSVSGTLLFFLILGLKQIYRDKFSKSWQYYIWLIVAIRFLIPITSDTTLIGYFFETMNTAIAQTQEVAVLEKAADEIEITAKETDTVNLQLDKEDNMLPLDKKLQNPIDFSKALFWIWAAFVLAFIIRKITIYQSFMRYMKAGNTEVSEIESLNVLADCEEQLKIRRNIELYDNPMIASPIMTGFFRPSIILPMSQFKKEDLFYIFTHELIHYKRRDMLYKWFIQLVLCIHWFNPFVYLLEKEINRGCELSCDEAVIHSLDEKERRAYGDLLLSSLKKKKLIKILCLRLP